MSIRRGLRVWIGFGIAGLTTLITGCGLVSRSGADPIATISDDDVNHLIQVMDEDRQRWIDGRYDPDARGEMEQAPDMTLFGPFGGPARTGGTEGSAGQRKANAAFKGGTGRTEVINAIRGEDLLVLILVEHNDVLFEGRTEPHPWNLRTTQVFRRDGERWIRLHRHADPLLSRRDLNETLKLAE